MTWELRYMGAIRGREREGRDPGFRRVLASLWFGLIRGSAVLPHRWRLARLSLSPSAPQASRSYQLCAKHTAAHGKTVPANLRLNARTVIHQKI